MREVSSLYLVAWHDTACVDNSCTREAWDHCSGYFWVSFTWDRDGSTGKMASYVIFMAIPSVFRPRVGKWQGPSRCCFPHHPLPFSGNKLGKMYIPCPYQKFFSRRSPVPGARRVLLLRRSLQCVLLPEKERIWPLPIDGLVSSLSTRVDSQAGFSLFSVRDGAAVRPDKTGADSEAFAFRALHRPLAVAVTT